MKLKNLAELNATDETARAGSHSQTCSVEKTSGELVTVIESHSGT